MVGGRIKHTLEEEGRAFLLGLPKVETTDRSVGADGRQDPCRASFGAGDHIQFTLEVWSRPLSISKVDSKALANGAALATVINVDADRKWELGTILTPEIITEIQAIGLPEVDIFEPL